MYSLSSQAKRPHWEDSDEGIHPQAPVRHSSRGISGTTASNSGVAAAIASSRARKSASQVAKQRDYEEVDNYLEEEEQAHFSPPMTYRNEKARFSTQGASAVGVFAVQGPGIDEENQVYDSTVDDYTNLGSEDRSMNNRNMTLNPSQGQEPIEAHRVSDDEEMHNQAKEIAEMVHKELMAKATVPVEVRSGGPPSTQDTSSLVTQEDGWKLVSETSVSSLWPLDSLQSLWQCSRRRRRRLQQAGRTPSLRHCLLHQNRSLRGFSGIPWTDLGRAAQ